MEHGDSTLAAQTAWDQLSLQESLEVVPREVDPNPQDQDQAHQTCGSLDQTREALHPALASHPECDLMLALRPRQRHRGSQQASI